MRQFFLLQQLGNDFRVFDGGGADQHRLAALMALADVGNCRLVFFCSGFVHPVQLVAAGAGPVRRNNHRLQSINLLELIGFGVCGTGHAGQISVQTEIVLKSDGRHGLVFCLDLDALFGFHSLVQSIAPAPPGHQTSGEFVNDDDFTRLRHVMLVAVVDVVRT